MRPKNTACSPHHGPTAAKQGTDVVATVHAGGGLPRLLDARKAQADQNRNDGEDDEQFDEGEPSFPRTQ